MKKLHGLFIVLPVLIIAVVVAIRLVVRYATPPITGNIASAPAVTPATVTDDDATAAQAAPDVAPAAPTPSDTEPAPAAPEHPATTSAHAAHTHAASAHADAARTLPASPALADTLANARKGDPFALTLPGDLHVSGTVNVVALRPDGTRHVGGKLDGWQRASFFLSLKDGQPTGGDVLIFDTERAFVLTTADDAGDASNITAATTSSTTSSTDTSTTDTSTDDASTDDATTAISADDAAPTTATIPTTATTATTTNLVWREKHLGEVICYPMPPGPDNDPVAAPADGPLAARLTPIPAYESRPGAPVVVLLDFDGATVEDTLWNTIPYNDGKPIVVSPSGLTDQQILNVWQRVSEDYAPFNVNITTDSAVYAKAAKNRRVRCIFTPDWEWYATVRPGGVAYMDVMGLDGELWPCWVFETGLDGAAESASHEIGHTFNLSHDGQNPASSNSSPTGEYYYGHGGSRWQQSPRAPMSWGPIMGAAYYTSVNQWSKNEYVDGVNRTGELIPGQQDDIHQIATQISATLPGYANDGIGATRAAAAPLAISGTSFVPQSGLILTASDANYHRLVLPESRTVALRAAPAVSATYVPNLNIAFELQNADGIPIITFGTGNTPSDNARATFNLLSATGTQTLASGTYFIKITGCGYKDPVTNGFSNYGSIGRYTLEGSIDAPFTADPDAPDIAIQPASETLVWSSGALTPATLPLSVTVDSANTPLFYLWHKDGQPLANTTRADGSSISGATTATLTIAPPVATDAGTYHVLVTDAAGRTVASQPAIVTVTPPAPPAITGQPVDFVLTGSVTTLTPVTFTLTATSDAPLHYQWLKDGSPLTDTGRYSGVTTATLVINKSDDDDGQSYYSARVTTPGGSDTSGSVRIVPAQLFDYHWTATGTADWSAPANWSDAIIPTSVATVYITNGGTAVIAGVTAAASGTATLGEAIGETGAVIVSGSGGWNINGNFHVGLSGTGKLAIADAGRVVLGATGAYTQNAASTLAIAPAVTRAAGPYITAHSATLAGALIITPDDSLPLPTDPFSLATGTILHTTGGAITGSFASVSFTDANGAASPAIPDYLTGTAGPANGGADYIFDYALTWQLTGAAAHGDFTVAPATATYTVPVPLANNTAETNPAWDGRSLSKYGPGTLILNDTAPNTYTGTTAIHAGILVATGTIPGPVVNNAILTAASIAGDVANNLSGMLFLADGTAPCFAGTLTNSGILDFASPAAGPYRTLTVNSFAGVTGEIHMTVNADGTGDRLVILDDATGFHAIYLTLTGVLPPVGLPSIPLITVGGENNTAFFSGGNITNGPFTYSLQRQPDGTYALARDPTSFHWDASGTAVWNNPANWLENALPIAADSVLINNGGTAVIGSGIEAHALDTRLGSSVGQSGAVIVNGNGLFASGYNVVGEHGAGKLTITDSGTVRGYGNHIAFASTSSGEVTVTGNGLWETGDDGITVGLSGTATLTLSDDARVTTTGTYSQNASSTLAITPSATRDAGPYITAHSATLAGALVITPDDSLPFPDDPLSLATGTIIHTTGGGSITGSFASVSFTDATGGGSATLPDYITGTAGLANAGVDYIFDYALTWQLTGTAAHGDFTIAPATATYTVPVPLANNTTETNPDWDGCSLSKYGPGTLILNDTASNTYTGTTAIHAGALVATGSLYGPVDNHATLTAASIAGPVTNHPAATLTLASDVACFAGTLTNNGILDFASPPDGPYRTLTVDSLAGTTGEIRMTANADGTGDRLVILDDATGAHAISLTLTGTLPPDGLPTLPLITVAANATATFSGVYITNAGFTYTLQRQPDGAYALTRDPATFNWAATGAGAWDNPANWLENTLPTAADSIHITNGGTAIIGNTIEARNHNARLGNSAGQSGAVIVNGSGLWNIGLTLFAGAGASGTGKLTITDSGTVLNEHWSSFGNEPGSLGEIIVSGSGLLASAYNIVGELGTGKLTITGHGTVRGDSGNYIGYASTGLGEVTITGSGLWDAGDFLTVGDSGTATLALFDDARVTTSVIAGAYTQNAASTLVIVPTATRAAGPYITAHSATLGGALVITPDDLLPLSADSPLIATGTILHTTGGAITGSFASVNFTDATGAGGATLPDYLTGTAGLANAGVDYVFDYGLAWPRTDALAHGNFTITPATATYTIPVPLADNTTHANPDWDGRSLHKYGPGTLVLSETVPSTYTGTTTIHAGALIATGTILGPVVNHVTLTAASIAGPVTNHSAATLTLAGDPAPSFDGTLTNNGILDFASPPDGPYRTLTIDSLAGTGTLHMTINADGAGDCLIILGDATGTHPLSLTLTGTLPYDGLPSFPLITVGGENTAAIFGNNITSGSFTYSLRRQPDGTYALARNPISFHWDATGTAAWENPVNWLENILPVAIDYVSISNGGTAVIGSGIEARNQDAWLGSSAGQSGAVIVNGSGLWNIRDTLFVGASGTGRLIITDSGTVLIDVWDSSIGSNGGSFGEIIVSGSGLLASGFNVVGSSGTGKLTITDHGTVRSYFGDRIAFAPASSGEVTIIGNGLWETGNAGNTGITVGVSGAATLALFDDARVITTGTYSQNAISTLAIVSSATRAAGPYITAHSATLAGALVITPDDLLPLSADSPLLATGTIIHTTGGAITGSFASVNFTDATDATGVAAPDYLTGAAGLANAGADYVFDYGLAWPRTDALAHGNFTITPATATYTIPVPLADNTTHANPAWDGRSLSKYGPGTLVLSETNINASTYTGTTTIHVGALIATGTIPGPVVNHATLTAATIAGPVTNHPAATLTLAGDPAPSFAGALTNNGILDFASPDAGPYRTLTIDALAGTTGEIRMTVNANGTGDRLVILGDATGAHAISLTLTGTLPPAGLPMLPLITIADNATVTATITGTITNAGLTYTLQRQPGGAYALVRNSTSFHWDATGTAAWNTPANWDTAAVPTATDTVYITNGGTAVIAATTAAASGTATLGDATGETGAIIVNGSGEWDVDGNFYIGKSGSGKLTITGNGTVRSDSVSYIGYAPSARGEVTITGHGLWETGGDGIAIGVSGTATLALSDDARVTTTGAYSQNAASTLAITPTATRAAGPYITAHSATLAGALVITPADSFPLSADSLLLTTGTIIHTTTTGGGAITGSFASVNFTAPPAVPGVPGAPAPALPDYITGTAGLANAAADYIFAYALSWQLTTPAAHGNFTITPAAATYTIPVPLADNTTHANPAWDGRSLSKYGPGTLVLSETNINASTYTGTTTIHVGALIATGTIPGPVVNHATLTAATIAGPVTNHPAATIALTGGPAARFAGALTNNGLLDFASPADGPYRTLTIDALAGTGTLRMTAALAATTGDAPDTPTGDRLVILGDTTGAQTLDLTIAAPPPAADALPLDADALRHLVTIHAPAPAATLTGTLVHGDFTYTLQQTPEGAITLRLHGFNPALGSKTEPALQTVTASHALSLEARGIDTNPDPLPPLIWQRLTPGDTTWTTLTGATVTGARLWLKNIPLAHDGVSYRHIVQNTPGAPVTSLPATLRVVPELTIPAGIAAAPDGALYIANPRDHLIQKVTPAPASNTNATPTIHTLAGAPAQPGSTDAAPPTAARFRSPQGIAITPAGDIYIADTGNHTIRRITNATAAASNNNATTRAVTLYAGAPAQSGSTDGEALSARFNAPAAIAATPAGDTLYIADTGNHTIRRITITPTRVTVTLFAGAPGKPGSDDNTTGAHARFRSPQGIALSAAGDIYVADTENAAIRKITPAAAVTTLGAGTPGGTTLVAPRGLAVDDTRHLLYISDADTHAIYVSDIGPGPFGGGRIIVPLAGAELDPDIRDALTGAAARFNAPWGLALDATGALHIADHANAALRQLAPTGAVTTLILTATTEPNNNGGGGGGTSGGGGSGSGGGGTSGGGGGGTSGGGGGGGGGGAPMPAVLALLAALLLSRALTRPRPPA